MDEPNGAEAWGNIPADGISPIHRPTSAPPVMELTQQLNGTDLAHQGFPGMDPAYFGVVSDGSDPRDPSVSGFFADSSKLGYLVRGCMMHISSAVYYSIWISFKDVRLQKQKISQKCAFLTLHLVYLSF